MNCSLDLHPRQYQLSTPQLLAMPLVSTFALRHLALANQETSTCKRLVHRVIAVIELIPIVGLFASLIERIIMLVRDCLFPKKEIPILEKTFPPEVENLIYSYLTIDEMKTLNVELKKSDEVLLKAERNNILNENPEYRNAVKFWDKNKISLRDQISRLKELRECIAGTEKWNEFISKLRKYMTSGPVQEIAREPNRMLYNKKPGIRGEIPQLPENIYEMMNRKDPTCNNLKIKDTHLITLIPKSIFVYYDIDLSLKFFMNAQKEGEDQFVRFHLHNADAFSFAEQFGEPVSDEDLPFNRDLFNEDRDQFLEKTVESTHWSSIKIKFPKQISANTGVGVITEFNNQHGTNYAYPNLNDMLVSCLLNSDRRSSLIKKDHEEHKLLGEELRRNDRNAYYLSFYTCWNSSIFAICQEKESENFHLTISYDHDRKFYIDRIPRDQITRRGIAVAQNL